MAFVGILSDIINTNKDVRALHTAEGIKMFSTHTGKYRKLKRANQYSHQHWWYQAFRALSYQWGNWQRHTPYNSLKKVFTCRQRANQNTVLKC